MFETSNATRSSQNNTSRSHLSGKGGSRAVRLQVGSTLVQAFAVIAETAIQQRVEIEQERLRREEEMLLESRREAYRHLRHQGEVTMEWPPPGTPTWAEWLEVPPPHPPTHTPHPLPLRVPAPPPPLHTHRPSHCR